MGTKTVVRIALDLRCLSIPEKAERGTGQVVRAMTRALARALPPDSLLLLLARDQENPLPGTAAAARCDWAYGDISRADWWGESVRAGRWISSLAPDLYHAPDLYLPRRCDVPMIVTVHDCYDLPLWGPVKFFGRAYGWRWNARFRWRYRWTWQSLSRARAIVTNSRATASAVARIHPFLTPRLHPVPWGVDSDWHAAPPSPGRARARFGLEGPFLLHVGGAEGRKNPEGLFGAYRILRETRPELSLVLAGPAQGDRPEEPGIRYLGRVSDEALRDLYDDAALLLFPSHEEGYGVPVIEAIARGCPVVTSRGTATEEVAAPWLASGRAALADPRDPAAIAAATARTLDVPRRGSPAGVRTFDDTARDLLVVYREAAGA